MKEQLSFFKEEEKPEIKLTLFYDATICSKWLCNMCTNSCEAELGKITKKKLKQQETCFNCDECYFYGMDDPTLSQTVVKFECSNFKMLNLLCGFNC